MMDHTLDTIVVGAGQAGLAAGFHLAARGARFLVVDAAAALGHSWSARWDSLRLFTPNRRNGLPGMPFPGDPSALPSKDEVAAYLRAYAAHHALPVRLSTPVHAVERSGDTFLVQTPGETLHAGSVIVATGAYGRPHVPDLAAGLAPRVFQLHSSRYRNNSQVPGRHVLVVGAGNSGVQIAAELAASHRVWLAGRDTGAIPRTLLGRDVYDWLWPTVMRPTVDSWLGRRLTHGRLLAGDPVIGVEARTLAALGVTRVGRVTATDRGLPVAEGAAGPLPVDAVVWCTGFRPDFRWIRLPVFGADGYPRHRRGLVPEAPGLAFVGLRFQSRIRSSLVGGVGDDAAFVVDHLMHERRRAA